jgi:hypothetical protein
MSKFRSLFSGYLDTKPPFRMLEDLESGVDHTDSKLNNAMSRMRKFVRENEGMFAPS